MLQYSICLHFPSTHTHGTSKLQWTSNTDANTAQASYAESRDLTERSGVVPPPPPFAPPKPTVADGLLTLMKVLSTTLATEKFEESMRKCFVDVGLAPAELTSDTACYKIYTDHSAVVSTRSSGSLSSVFLMAPP